MTVIPRSRFDTRQLPAKIALDTWREQISTVFDSRISKTDHDGFFASVDARLIDDVVVGQVCGSGQQFSRSRRKIAGDGMDGYILQFYGRGQSRSLSDGATASAGDFYVIDMAQPLATATNDHAQLSIVVPRRLLSPLLKNPDDCHELVLPSPLPMVSLLRDTCISFSNNLPSMTAAAARTALPAILQLTAATVNSEVDEKERAAVQTALCDAIRRHIEANLLAVEMSPETVMGAFGISRRTLYRLFEPVGGFNAYLQKQRLRRARDALRAPEHRHLTIAEIAQAHGFANPESFSRAFRSMFNLTPREARHLSPRELAVHRSAVRGADWSQWLRQIGR